MIRVPEWKIVAPKNDDEYFERMNRAIIQADLNWKDDGELLADLQDR